MRKCKKRLLCLLLTLVLAVSLVPAVSLPASALYLEDTSLQCTWILQDDVPLSDGTTGLKLTIWPTTGDGRRMDNYAYLAQNWVSTVPWASYIPQIEEVELTDGVLNVGGNIVSYFKNNSTRLKKIIFADSVEEIGWNAFYREWADETPLEVDWGSGIKSVQSTAFTRSGVTKVCLPAVEEIGVSAFKQCKKLESVYIASKDWLKMEKSVFEGCTDLKEATLVGYVREIPAYTFSSCKMLQSVSLPASVESIEKDAFYNCKALSAVYYAGTPQQWAQIRIAEGNECLQKATVLYNSTPYTIAFDANGGSVSPASMVTAASGKLPSLPTPTRPGYSFVGWFTAQEGGDSVSTNRVFNGDATIYAHWFRYLDSNCAVTVNQPMAGCHPATTAKSGDTSRYKVTSVYFSPLNGNTEGPKLTADDSFAPGQRYRIHVRLTPVGEWAFSDETPATINGLAAESEGVSMGGDAWYFVDLTATEAPVCEVTFHPMGGQVIPTSATTGSDGRLGSFPTPTREGYKFTGWYAAPAGETVIPKDTVFTEDTTIYAHWRKNEEQPSNPFLDVTSDQYYYEPVLWAVNHDPQITSGTDSTHFSPAAPCTRAQVVTFLWRAAGQPEPSKTASPFTDVQDKSQYYYKAVLWAVEKGITNGATPTTFNPKGDCTRGQVVTFLWRAQNKPSPGSTSNPFVDVPAGQYYYQPVLWAVNHTPQITNGTDSTHFSPSKTCTRGQIVTFLYRAMK